MPTEACATFDDVNLILRLYELRREEKMRQAREWFSKSFTARSLDEFNSVCPAGSEQNAWFRMVVSYWEMVASFITSGVLNQELFFQSGHELLMVWEKIRDTMPQARERMQNPAMFKNLEKVAQEYIKWMEKQGPEAYKAFSAAVRST